MSRTRQYGRTGLIAAEFPPEEIPARLAATPDSAVWLDMCQPSRADLEVVIAEFGLHPLAVDDALKRTQRVKLDRYQSHLFLTTYAIHFYEDGGLNSSEIATFITPRALITIRDDDWLDVDNLVARWEENVDLAGNGVAYLLHGLLDVVVDGHFAAVQRLDAAMETLPDMLFETGRPQVREVQQRLFQDHRTLVRLRQVLLPMREVVNFAMRPTVHLITDQMVPYYQDVYDHVLRAIEWTESLRDLTSTMLETNVTVQNNRLNEIMKKVTAWAAIIAVPTAVTSFYGQNVAIPGRDELWGFLVSLAVMVGLAVVLFMLFRRKDWI